MKLYFLHKRMTGIQLWLTGKMFNYPFVIMIEETKIIFKPPDSSSFEAEEISQSQFKKYEKHTETLVQKSAILNDTDFTDNDNLIEKRYRRMVIFFTRVHH